MAPKLITEFIGTFFLVLIIALCVAGGNPDAARLAPIPIGVGLAVMVYMGGHISGAHYNPAVTLAVFLRGKTEAGTAAAYMLVQIAAAVFATFTARGITGNLLAVAPAAGVSIPVALAVEGLFTFALALVVLNAATARATQGNSYYGLAIGGTVLAAAFAGGGISGGAFNPAVGLGPALTSLLSGAGLPGHAWLYAVGPLMGGAAAAMVFRIQNKD